MRKLFGILLIVGLALCLTNSLALAVPTVNIHDVIEGQITVDFSGFIGTPTNFASGGEFMSVDVNSDNFGRLADNIGLAIGNYGAYMKDPGGAVSDYAVLHVTGPKAFNVQFYSDGYAEFEPEDFLETYQNATFVVESGALQPLFSAPGLQINAASEVPLPPTVLLMGSGLLGLVGWRRFRKS